MARIKKLDKNLVQKIAAGEVIERPASIVKELVENSLDANAKNITIEIKNGGKSLIRVTDDGDGIDESDIELAFMRHSTSKLSNIDDLYNIMTLGFRGEALASIASISKVEVLTKTKGANAGLHVFIEEGEVQSIERVGSAKGTTMIIRDIFYNLPVRKKFLRSDSAEGNSISDIINKIALGNSQTSFKLIKDNRVVLNSSNTENLLENIYSILGKDIIKGLIPINYQDDYIKFQGFISNNSLYRSNRSHQYFYLNGRYITDYQLANAIQRNYSTIIPSNRHPVFIVFLEINPNEVDVNIHPTKQEVKFEDINRVYDTLYDLVKDSLSESLTSPIFKSNKSPSKKDQLPRLFELEESDDNNKEVVIKDLSDGIASFKEFTEDYNFVDSQTREEFSPDEDHRSQAETIEINSKSLLLNDIRESSFIATIFNTYILLENKKEDSIFIIDQHAAHERIMYESIKREYERESISIQKLLVPEVFQLTNKEYNLVEENIELFESLGFEISEFGSNTIQLRGVPLVFGKPNVRNLFLDILDNLETEIKTSYELKLDRIMKLACTKAVKSGDKLTKIEVDRLIEDLIQCDNPFNCPHGRPTIIVVEKNELEKEFLRT